MPPHQSPLFLLILLFSLGIFQNLTFYYDTLFQPQSSKSHFGSVSCHLVVFRRNQQDGTINFDFRISSHTNKIHFQNSVSIDGKFTGDAIERPLYRLRDQISQLETSRRMHERGAMRDLNQLVGGPTADGVYGYWHGFPYTDASDGHRKVYMYRTVPEQRGLKDFYHILDLYTLEMKKVQTSAETQRPDVFHGSGFCTTSTDGYVFGGIQNGGQLSDLFLRLNFATMVWNRDVNTATNKPSARDSVPLACNDEYLLIVGGRVDIMEGTPTGGAPSVDVSIYNYNTNSFTAGTFLDSPRMNHGAEIYKSYYYSFGGYMHFLDPFTHPSVIRYNIETEVWDVPSFDFGSDMLFYAAKDTSTVLIGHYIYTMFAITESGFLDKQIYRFDVQDPGKSIIPLEYCNYRNEDPSHYGVRLHPFVIPIGTHSVLLSPQVNLTATDAPYSKFSVLRL